METRDPCTTEQVRRRRVTLSLLVVVSLILLTAYFGEDDGEPAALGAAWRRRGALADTGGRQPRAEAGARPVRLVRRHARRQEGTRPAQSAARRAAQKVVDYQVAIQENEELQRLVKHRQRLRPRRIHAVTARVISPFAQQPLQRHARQVDAGTGAGVHVGDAVISGDGLVGQVTTAAGNAAQRDADHRPEIDRQRRMLDAAATSGSSSRRSATRSTCCWSSCRAESTCRSTTTS